MVQQLRPIERLDEERLSRVVEKLRPLMLSKDTSIWAIADLLLEEFPVGGRRDPLIRLYLEKIAWLLEVDWDTLRTYRSIANSWPRTLRNPAASFGLHRLLTTHPERARLILLPRKDAMKELGKAVPDPHRAHSGEHARHAQLVGIKKVVRSTVDLLADESIPAEARIRTARRYLTEFLDAAGE